MKTVIIFYTIVIGFFSIIMISCVHSLPDASQMTHIYFYPDVYQIYYGNCAKSGCHLGGEYPLDDYPSIRNSVEPGNPKNSTSYQAIISKWINAMPPDKALNQDARTIIRIWIEQGAQNDTVPPSPAKSAIIDASGSNTSGN